MEGGRVFSQQQILLHFHIASTSYEHISALGSGKRLCAGSFPLQFLANGSWIDSLSYSGSLGAVHARSSDSNILHNSILHSCIVSNNLDYNDSQQEHREDGDPRESATSSGLGEPSMLDSPNSELACSEGVSPPPSALGSVRAAPTRATWDVSGHYPKDKGNQRVMTDHPFSGDYRSGTWNSQALFAVNTHVQFPKKRKASRLISENDVQFLQETHSQQGSANAWTPP